MTIFLSLMKISFWKTDFITILSYDRIDLKGVDLTESNYSKGCIVCHY